MQEEDLEALASCLRSRSGLHWYQSVTCLPCRDTPAAWRVVNAARQGMRIAQDGNSRPLESWTSMTPVHVDHLEAASRQSICASQLDSEMIDEEGNIG